MYLRFVTPLIHPQSRVESGFFRASWYIHQNACPDWIRQELSDQFKWFAQHLLIPGRIARHFKRRDSIWGICYPIPKPARSARQALLRAWLLDEGGLPVRTIATSCEREVIWRDAHQIVTKPSADLPKAFS